MKLYFGSKSTCALKPRGKSKYLGALPVDIPLSSLFKSQLLSKLMFRIFNQVVWLVCGSRLWSITNPETLCGKVIIFYLV